jgi:zinc/manganese transport system ATP-binding protein
MSTKAPAIGFHDLTLGYDRHPAVHHVSGEVGSGELLALVGPNGAGKSTLLKGIMGEVKPLGGVIDLHGLSRRDIAYLPQQIDIDRSFPISVFDCVGLGLWREIGIFGGFDAQRKRAVAGALAGLGLLDLAHRAIGSLSGGQLQRVLFARLMLQDARLILLDEPFRAIDTQTVADLMTLIARWHGEGRTIIAALHDIEQVRAHFAKTLILAREVVAWGETRKVLSPANLAKARALLEAFDTHAEICARGEERERQPA